MMGCTPEEPQEYKPDIHLVASKFMEIDGEMNACYTILRDGIVENDCVIARGDDELWYANKTFS